MPANPPAIHTAPGAAPTAPGAVHVVAAASPSAPGAVHVAPTLGGGVQQVVTLTVTVDSSNNGYVVVTPVGIHGVFGAGTYNAAVISGVLSTDTVADIAQRIRDLLPTQTLISGGALWGDHFEVSGTGADAVLTFKAAAANIANPIGFNRATTTGTTATIVVTTAGQAGSILPTPPAIVTGAPSLTPSAPGGIHSAPAASPATPPVITS